MQHFQDEWIQEWCDLNGWTDLVRESYNNYWAFPPNCVMPEPIPVKAIRMIKSEKGLSNSEWKLLALTGIVSIIALLYSYFCKTPMPLMLAFGFSAISFARMECEI